MICYNRYGDTMIVEIKNKILNNDLISFTDEEIEIISNNIDLLNLFLTKITEGVKFDLDIFNDSLEEFIFKNCNFKILLSNLFSFYPDIVVDFFTGYDGISFYDELEEFHTGAGEEAKSFYDEHRDEIIKLFLANYKDYHLVSNPDFINAIIDNKLYDASIDYKKIDITEEIESFVIESLKNKQYERIPYSPKIFKYCKDNNICYVLSAHYKDHPEIVPYILEEFNNFGIQNFKLLDYCFLSEYRNEPSIIKYELENNFGSFHISFDEIDYEQYPELIDATESYIRKNEISLLSEPNVMAIPRLFNASLEFDTSFFEYITFHEMRCESFNCSKNENPEALVKSIDIYLEKNADDGYNFLTYILRDYNEVFIPLIRKQISKLTFESYYYMITRDNSDFNYAEELKKYEDCLLFTINKISNVKITNDLADSAKIKVIMAMNKDDLTPVNIPENVISNTEIAEAIVERLAELKSESFNNSLYYFSKYITPNMLNIFFREDNPLNIPLSSKIRFISENKEKIGKNHNSVLLDVLDKSENLTINDISLAISQIINVQQLFDPATNSYVLQEIDVKQIEKLATIIRNKKIEKDANFYQSIVNIFPKLSFSASKSQEIEKKYLDQYLKPVFKEILLEYTDVPLNVSMLFDEELRRNSTYNYDNLTNNYEIFVANDILPEDFYTFIKEAVKEKVTIDYRIIGGTYLAQSELFLQGHFTYADSSALDMCYNQIKSLDISYFEKFIEELSPNTLSDQKYIFLLRKIYSNESQLKVLYNKIKDKNIIHETKIFDALLIEYKDKEFEQTIKSYILNLIKENRLYINDNMFEETFIHIDVPEIEDFFIKNYFSVKKSFKELIKKGIFEKIKEKDCYYQALLENIKMNPEQIIEYEDNIINDQNMVDLYINYINNNDYYFYTPKKIHYKHDVMEALLNKQPEYVKKYIQDIIHNQQQKAIKKEEYDLIVDTFLKINPEIPKGNVDILYKLYDTDLIRLLENDKILELLQKDSTTIERFVKLFKVRDMDTKTVEAINDSIQQHIYMNNNAYIINIFTNILECIQNEMSEEEEKGIINTLCEDNYHYLPLTVSIIVPNDISENDKKDFELLQRLYPTNKERFFEFLFYKIKINQNIYSPILHQITAEFIAKKRNDVNRNEDIYEDTNIEFSYDRRQQLEAAFKYLIKNNQDIINLIIQKHSLSTEEVITHKNTLLILDGKENQVPKEELFDAKRNIRLFKKLIFDNLDSYIDLNEIPKEVYKNVTKIPQFKRRERIYEQVGSINFSTIYDIIGNEAKYKSLISIIEKTKILEWDHIFDNLIKELSLGEDNIDLYIFINAFNTIYDVEYKNMLKQRNELIEVTIQEMRQLGKSEEEIQTYRTLKESEPIEININPYKLLKYSVMYSSIGNSYKIILGLEDFEYVKKNEGPNSAHKGSMIERLEYDCKLMIELMQNNQVTIPSFVYNYEYEQNENEDKKKHPLQAIVGCRGDSRNLTQGERTGACMRAYGHAHDLFTFTNTDPRGFHITFVDPITNKYISRVSGFRNGNTVFLNQLRYSCDTSNYSNADIYDACCAVGRELIERSKNSEMPIENVVCSPCYSLYKYPTVTLSEMDIGRGVYSGYKDVSYNAVLIATADGSKTPSPVKLDADNQPIYKPCRLPGIEYTNEKINQEVMVKIQRIDAIKECLQNKDNPNYYLCIDFDFDLLDTKMVYVIIGQDFYVALTSDNQVIKNIAVDSVEGNLEYNEAIKKVEEYKEHLVGGGFGYGK